MTVMGIIVRMLVGVGVVILSFFLRLLTFVGPDFEI